MTPSERAMAWAKANPKKKKANDANYVARNRGKVLAGKRARRVKNVESIRAYEQLFIRKLSDPYLRTLLRRQGVVNPTVEQLAAKRRQIYATRAQFSLKTFLLCTSLKAK